MDFIITNKNTFFLCLPFTKEAKKYAKQFLKSLENDGRAKVIEKTELFGYIGEMQANGLTVRY